MDGSHFGDLGLGSGRSGSSRKGKKSSDKQKQPQRGLGVAQLEKIRLQNQVAAYLPSTHSPFLSNSLNKEEDMRFEMAYSSSPTSSSTTASSSSLFGLLPNTMMGFGDTGRRQSIYNELQSSHASRSLLNNGDLFLPHHVTQSTTMLPLLDETTEDMVQKKRRHDLRHSTDSISQNSDSSEAQEVDLELKLSL